MYLCFKLQNERDKIIIQVLVLNFYIVRVPWANEVFKILCLLDSIRQLFQKP